MFNHVPRVSLFPAPLEHTQERAWSGLLNVVQNLGDYK